MRRACSASLLLFLVHLSVVLGQKLYLDEALNETCTLSIIPLSLDGIQLHLGALLMLVPVLMLMLVFMVVLVTLVLLVEALGGLDAVGLLLLELLLRRGQQP